MKAAVNLHSSDYMMVESAIVREKSKMNNEITALNFRRADFESVNGPRKARYLQGQPFHTTRHIPMCKKLRECG